MSPRIGSGPGRFEGNIWIEDRGYNIVRFNGTYSGASPSRMFFHFDSWRLNAGPDLWLPYEVYSEESHLTNFMKTHTVHFKALTKFWAYGGPAERSRGELDVYKRQDHDSSVPSRLTPSLQAARRIFPRCISRQPDLMRFQAASRSKSVTPSTGPKREIALRP